MSVCDQIIHNTAFFNEYITVFLLLYYLNKSSGLYASDRHRNQVTRFRINPG